MKKNAKYRRWQNIRGDQHYLMIHPKGICLQISFETDTDGTHVKIFQTEPGEPMDDAVLAKYKEVCRKSDWEAARRQASLYLRGDMIHVSLMKQKMQPT